MSGKGKDNAVSTLMAGPRLVAFFVDGTGTASVSGPDADLVTLTDNGTGDYTLTFATTLQQTPFVFAPMSHTADVMAAVTTAISTTAVRIKTRTVATSPAAVDADFQVMMLVDMPPSSYLLGA